MIRVFTTSFLFNGHSYNAIVIQKTNNGKLSFTINVLNEDLKEWIPEGLVRLESEEGLENMEVRSSHLNTRIINSITASIQAHLVSIK
jgi:hypothetical protein